jgi:TRAP-type C4-dicarboxylate transport system substrate-binding protein
VPVQTKLSFMKDLLVAHLSVWDQLEEEDKRIVLEMLAHVIAKMIAAEQDLGNKQ